MSKPKTGKLILVPNGDGKQDTFYFETAGDVFFPLKFEEGVDPYALPRNKEITLRMSAEPINYFYVVTDGS